MATTATVLPQLHIGEASRYANLDWFPVWATATPVERRYKTNTLARLRLEESAEPDPDVLDATNISDDDVALFEGSLIDAGFQHRSLTRTIVLPAHTRVTLPVVCVERGRWDVDDYDGDSDIEATFTRAIAPLHVRRAMRGVSAVTGNIADMFDMSMPDQHQVWAAVSAYSEATTLGVETESLLALERRYATTYDDDTPVPMPGQTGVIVAHGGYPVAMELFDHPDTLNERFGPILSAFRLDSHDRGYIETPSRRARRFAHIVNNVELAPTGRIGTTTRHRSQPNAYVATESTWFDGSPLHLTSFNLQHALAG